MGQGRENKKDEGKKRISSRLGVTRSSERLNLPTFNLRHSKAVGEALSSENPSLYKVPVYAFDKYYYRKY